MTTNSMRYGTVWVGNASLFFKAFQDGRPNWNDEKVRPLQEPSKCRYLQDRDLHAIFHDVA
jgi:hypothetical protein